jgi:hypothetical protein
MRANIYGYGRASVWKRAATLQEQCEAISAYLDARNVPPYVKFQFAEDAETSFKQDFRQRPIGKELWCELRNLRSGGHLIVASLDRIFNTLRDCSLTLRLLGPGIVLHVANLRRPLHELTPGQMADALDGMMSAARSERAAFAVRESKYGRPVNGSSPYGFKWVRLSGSGKWSLVPDVKERELMRQLLAWQEEGRSFDEMRQILAYRLRRGFVKESGKKKHKIEWSNGTLWRRVQAQKRLQEQESQAQRSG